MKSIGLPNVNSSYKRPRHRLRRTTPLRRTPHTWRHITFQLERRAGRSGGSYPLRSHCWRWHTCTNRAPKRQAPSCCRSSGRLLQSLGYTVTKDVRFIDDATRKLSIADLVLSVDPIVAATVEGKALITGASGAAIPGVRAIEVLDFGQLNAGVSLNASRAVIEVKAGQATLTKDQQSVYKSLSVGNVVVPVGLQAARAGLIPDVPLEVALPVMLITAPGVKE